MITPSLWPFWRAGEPVTSGSSIVDITHPADGSIVGRHPVPTPADVEVAVAAAAQVSNAMQATSAAQRAAALSQISTELADRAEEMAHLITAENGKPLMWSRVEVQRAISTFRWAAEEARRFGGEFQRLDTEPSSAGRAGLIRRFPHGPVLGISPFNFPLNLTAHKVAPAIAVGAPIVIKPAPSTPLSSLLLGELLSHTELPAGAWSVLPVPNEMAPALVADERLPVVSFTGSDTVGYAIQAAVPRKHVVLELGGNAAAVVLADWNSDADLAFAAQRIAMFGNYQAGQSCISVQRVFIAEPLVDRFVPLLTDAVAALQQGSSWDESTAVGPLINEAAAARVEQWVDEAVTTGARVLVGGTRDGAAYAPTVLIDAPANAKVNQEEVFGPVMTVTPIADLADAINRVNDSRFGLQTGVFTHDVQAAFTLHRELEVGGVIIGDVPSFRADQMPYGGVKASGSGREGLRSAMWDFTHERVMVFANIDL